MSDAALKRKKASYEDILKLPENMVGEIIDGELHVSPRPGTQHGFAEITLSKVLGPFYGHGSTPGGWWILAEPELHLGKDPNDNVFVPDLAGWRTERVPELPKEAHISIVPDWVCEILSPSNARLDRAKKMPKYASFGVAHLWLIDPKAKTLEAYRLEKGKWLLLQTLAESDKARVEPFDALEFDLGALWL